MTEIKKHKSLKCMNYFDQSARHLRMLEKREVSTNISVYSSTQLGQYYVKLWSPELPVLILYFALLGAAGFGGGGVYAGCVGGGVGVPVGAAPGGPAPGYYPI